MVTEGKTRVFVSFDYDNDRTLKEFIIGVSTRRFAIHDRRLVDEGSGPRSELGGRS